MRAIIIIIFTVMMAGTCKAQTFDFSCGPAPVSGSYQFDGGEVACSDVAIPITRFYIKNNILEFIDWYFFGLDKAPMRHDNEVNPLYNFVSLIDDQLTITNGECESTYTVTQI